MVVDYHAHWCPPAYIELIEGRADTPRIEANPEGGWIYSVDDNPPGNQWNWESRFFDLEENVADMDAGNVDVSVLTPALVGGDLTTTDLGFAKEALGLINAELAGAKDRFPDRLRPLAMLPLQDVDASVEMLDHAIGELGMSGVCISTNLLGASIAPPRLLPLYERIEELGVPIVFHPSFRSTAFESSVKPSTEGGVGGRIVDVSLAWVYDTSLAVLALISNGVFDACPGLNVLHPHSGGVIPYIRGRVGTALSVPRSAAEFTLDRPLNEYLQTNVYVDCAAGSSQEMLDMCVETYGIDHILFGTDHPFFPRADYDELLGSLREGMAEAIRSNRLPGIDYPAA